MAINHWQQPFYKSHDHLRHKKKEEEHLLVPEFLNVERNSINGRDPNNNETRSPTNS